LRSSSECLLMALSGRSVDLVTRSCFGRNPLARVLSAMIGHASILQTQTYSWPICRAISFSRAMRFLTLGCVEKRLSIPAPESGLTMKRGAEAGLRSAVGLGLCSAAFEILSKAGARPPLKRSCGGSEKFGAPVPSEAEKTLASLAEMDWLRWKSG